MKDLPTAEEFLEQYLRGDRVHDDINRVIDEEEAIQAIIEFAKLHVESCKREIINNVETCIGGDGSPLVSIASIINSYPLKNIK